MTDVLKDLTDRVLALAKECEGGMGLATHTHTHTHTQVQATASVLYAIAASLACGESVALMNHCVPFAEAQLRRLTAHRN